VRRPVISKRRASPNSRRTGLPELSTSGRGRTSIPRESVEVTRFRGHPLRGDYGCPYGEEEAPVVHE
jgi:hypothetical protein